MAYDDHPLYSDKGIQILKDIYSGLYKIEKDAATGTYEIGADLKTNVVHFNNNKVGIVYNLRRFLTSTTRIAIPDTVDSGIYMCDPMNGGCGRRSFMYDWEFVDFGVYGNLANWLGNVSLDLQKIKNTLGIQVMCRVKCNDFTQCGECHQTSAGHFSNCIYCTSSNVTTGGCAKESWTTHTVQERTAENICAQQRSDIIPTQLYEIMSGSGKLKAPEVSTTGIFAFRITYNGPATGQVNTYLDAVEHIPNMEIGYQVGAYRKPYGFTCDTCGDERYFPPPTADHPFGAPMTSNNIDTTYTANLNAPQTGGIYQGIGKNANSNQCLKCAGTYQPNMGWDVGRPKVCGPLDSYTDEYNRHYREQQFARTHNALPTKYPLSTMKWAFTMDPLIRCGSHGYRGSSYGYSDPMLWTERAMSRCYRCGQFNNYGVTCNNCDNKGLVQGTDYNMEIFPANSKLQFCPTCGPENTPYDQLYTDEFTSGNPYLFPREKLVIVNPQPFLTNTDDQMLTMGGNATNIGGRGAYLINLNSISSNDYRYQMYLPVIYSTDLVPETMDDIHTNAPSGAGSDPCPHDFMHQPPPPTTSTGTPAGAATPGGSPPTAQGCCSIGTTQILADQTTCLSMGGTYAGDGTTCVNPTTQAVVSGNRIADPCAGVTMEGLSFMIAEGRATSAFKNRAGVYVDDSPNCRSYRDPGSPASTGGPIITYPRFTQVIGDDPKSTTQGGTVTAGPRYLFCDPNAATTGIICDPYHKSALATVTAGMSGQLGVTTHTLRQVGIREDPNYGFIEEINCETCAAIAREGEQLAKRNDPLGRGTPFPKVDPSDWTTCGGAATLREAWQASPQVYHPGMGVLLYRSRLGQIQVNGWQDDFTPDCSFPKQSQYVETCLQGELALEANGFTASPTGMENIPCPGGWWNWALHSGGCTTGSLSQPCESWRIRSARGDTIVL